ncbi:AAA family ATPase [Priestia megaterium]|uniref:AAA family ATPase n=1 Tax=Priestia megaterium TaxID=1404 RepID=UPI0036D9B4DF
MEIIKNIEDLKKGTVIDNQNLVTLFKCSSRGGMRRSLKTNSLVLLSFKGRKPYEDIRKDNELWKYTAMGRVGNQNLDFMQNKTLLNSNENGIKVYLFIVENNNYTFIDRVLLAGAPEKERQQDEEGLERDVWVFPLIEIGKEVDMHDFLFSQERGKLEKDHGVLSFPQFELSRHSADPLSTLMSKQAVDTLTAPGGWFFTKTKFFNNPNTKSKHKSGYIDKIIEEDPRVSKGIIFEGQNKFINPFYRTSKYKLPSKKEKTLKEFEELGFLIRKIQYKYSGTDWIKLDFSKKKSIDTLNRNNPFVSLLIGPNGTGKSTVLANLQKIFLDAFNYADSRKTSHVSNDLEYKVTYQLGNDIYEICNGRNLSEKEYYKNGERVSFQQISLPRKLIASAFSINDRFTFNQQSENLNDRYSYLGIKSSDNTAKVGETTKNLVLNILRSSQKDNFHRNLKYITDFIDIEPVFRIKYPLKKGKISDVINDKNIIYLQNKLRTQPKEEVEKINFVDNKDVIDFFDNLLANQYNNNIFIFDDNFISIDFNFSAEDRYDEYYEEFYILWHLFELGIFDEPIVYLKKFNYYKLENASSGESQYITTLINILSKIEKDSLIIIDEPETSLHPNWQYKYVHGIREIFKNYSSCHFVMATHSHFLISDLTPDTSSIISFRKEEDNELISELHDEKTFGWSPDDILYNIFHMKSARNFYLEEDLTNLLSYISSKDTSKRGEIERIFNKLTKLTLKPNDPLNIIIENARGYLENA